MNIICPSILALSTEDFKDQVSRASSYATRLHIDLMDGTMTDTNSVNINDLDLLKGVSFDIHLMSIDPEKYLDKLVSLKPNMVIVQAESDADIPLLASKLRESNIRTGLSVLPETSIDSVSYLFPHIQQLLIFSGHLGHFGGVVDLSLVDKINEAKKLSHSLEYAWDGGINLDDISKLYEAGINVFDVGSALASASDPRNVYDKMNEIISNKN